MKQERKSVEIENLEKKVLYFFANNTYKDFSIKDIYSMFGFKDRKFKQKVKSIIMDMKEHNILVKNGTRFFIHPQYVNKETSEKHYMTGTVEILRSGKIIVQDKQGSKHVRISAQNASIAMDGDIVKVYVFPKRQGKYPEGQIVEIIKRKKTIFSGVLYKKKHFALIICNENNIEQDIIVYKYDTNIEDGTKVIVKIVDWKPSSNNPVGEIIKVLGQPGQNDVEMQSILIENELNEDFDAQVIKKAEKITDKITKKELSNRMDYRNMTTFTIDPSDAKDFDDAISFKLLENNNYLIGVHIADVSYYVDLNDEIDQSAFQRATSIYLVDRVIPMLPENLCNNVCSLVENKDRLTYSVMFEMSPTAEIVDFSIHRSVINSDKRFTYEQVQAIIEASEYGTYYQPSPFSPQITLLWKIAKILRQKRFDKGAIKFSSPEYKFELDDNKKPVSVTLKQSKQANWLVEEYMLLANKTVAEFIGKVSKKKDIKTFVYRVHDEPNADKLETFKSFAQRLGYKINSANRDKLIQSYNNIFDKVKNTSLMTLINTVALRTMSKAYYSTDNIGHYGLAEQYYTHFTSPIRRYPDIMVHRLLTAYMNQEPSKDKEFYEECCEHCSQMERKAQQAEHDSIKYKQAEFLSDKIGQKFDGEVSGVSKWGLFVMLDDNKCEGLVKIASLKDDFYQLDEDNYQLKGMEFGNTYQLGQKVTVRVLNVNMLKRQINLQLIANKDID